MPESHIPGYNYLGPGTEVSKRLSLREKDAGHIPVNELDRAAMRHDLLYYDTDWGARARADALFVKEVRDAKGPAFAAGVAETMIVGLATARLAFTTDYLKYQPTVLGTGHLGFALKGIWDAFAAGITQGEELLQFDPQMAAILGRAYRATMTAERGHIRRQQGKLATARGIADLFNAYKFGVDNGAFVEFATRIITPQFFDRFPRTRRWITAPLGRLMGIWPEAVTSADMYRTFRFILTAGHSLLALPGKAMSYLNNGAPITETEMVEHSMVNDIMNDFDKYTAQIGAYDEQGDFISKAAADIDNHAAKTIYRTFHAKLNEYIDFVNEKNPGRGAEFDKIELADEIDAVIPKKPGSFPKPPPIDFATPTPHMVRLYNDIIKQETRPSGTPTAPSFSGTPKPGEAKMKLSDISLSRPSDTPAAPSFSGTATATAAQIRPSGTATATPTPIRPSGTAAPIKTEPDNIAEEDIESDMRQSIKKGFDAARATATEFGKNLEYHKDDYAFPEYSDRAHNKFNIDMARVPERMNKNKYTFGTNGRLYNNFVAITTGTPTREDIDKLARLKIGAFKDFAEWINQEHGKHYRINTDVLGEGNQLDVIRYWQSQSVKKYLAEHPNANALSDIPEAQQGDFQRKYPAHDSYVGEAKNSEIYNEILRRPSQEKEFDKYFTFVRDAAAGLRMAAPAATTAAPPPAAPATAPPPAAETTTDELKYVTPLNAPPSDELLTTEISAAQGRAGEAMEALMGGTRTIPGGKAKGKRGRPKGKKGGQAAQDSKTDMMNIAKLIIDGATQDEIDEANGMIRAQRDATSGAISGGPDTRLMTALKFMEKMDERVAAPPQPPTAPTRTTARTQMSQEEMDKRAFNRAESEIYVATEEENQKAIDSLRTKTKGPYTILEHAHRTIQRMTAGRETEATITAPTTAPTSTTAATGATAMARGQAPMGPIPEFIEDVPVVQPTEPAARRGNQLTPEQAGEAREAEVPDNIIVQGVSAVMAWLRGYPDDPTGDNVQPEPIDVSGVTTAPGRPEEAAPAATGSAAARGIAAAAGGPERKAFFADEETADAVLKWRFMTRNPTDAAVKKELMMSHVERAKEFSSFHTFDLRPDLHGTGTPQSNPLIPTGATEPGTRLLDGVSVYDAQNVYERLPDWSRGVSGTFPRMTPADTAKVVQQIGDRAAIQHINRRLQRDSSGFKPQYVLLRPWSAMTEQVTRPGAFTATTNDTGRYSTYRAQFDDQYLQQIRPPYAR